MITGEQVLEALKEVVAGKEKYYYKDTHTSCKYADADGNPSCVVGHAIFKLDPDLFQKIKQIEAKEGSFPITRLLNWYAEEIGTDSDGLLPISVVAAELLEYAQFSQDGGHSWGTALEEAETAFARGN